MKRLRRRLRALPWRRIGLGSAIVLFLLIVVAPLRRATLNLTSQAIFLATTPFAPNVSNFTALPQGTKVVAADGSPIVELDGTQKLQPIALKDVPPEVQHAVLAAEDANFKSHPGVDASALLRAAWNNIRGRSEQGGSTITQQLAKLNYTNRQRTVFRKVKEVLYAAQLERKYSKDELLQRYLNQVYFGDGAYGIAAASNQYFATTPDKLTPAQASMLAGKIHSPSTLDPRKEPEKVRARRDEVLRAMHKHHWLSDADLTTALAATLDVAPPSASSGSTNSPTSYFVELVKREAQGPGFEALGGSADARLNQLFTGGYTIETTLDPKVLAATTESVQKELGKDGDPSAAAVTVQPGDGAIRNLFGGLDFSKNQFDVASQGARQPGSSFKPFVYIAALRNGIDPRTQFPSDSPMNVPCGPKRTVPVNNYEGEGGGLMNVDDAMAHSVNVVFMQLICKIGPDKVVQVAKDLHFSEPINSDPAIALGGLTKGVSPLEMAAAYATFAAKGLYAQPYSIAQIRDRTGQVIYTHKVQTQQVLDPNQAGVLTAALEGVVDHGTGTGAKIGRPVAGKTGTTENYGNAWFVGYTPQLATAVWVGHVEGDVPMTKVHGGSVAGGRYPATIFAATMKAALDGQPVEDLFTASPDDLNLKPATPDTAPPTSAGSTTTEPSTTTTTAQTTPQSTTTSTPADTTPTTAPPKQTTTTSPPQTTTTAPRSTTSTTAAGTQQQSATTTTSPP